MNIVDLSLLAMVQDSMWAMHLPKLEEITSFFEKRINGVTIDFSKTAEMKSGNTAEQTFQNKESIAIIPIFGSLLKRANLVNSMSGGSSMQLIQRDIQAALDDESVVGVLLNVDSPGGTVDGTKQLADFIYSKRGTKPIVAFTDGMMCSAAYWISSAADYRIAYDTASVGSIGVATVHYDYSKADENKGVKRTLITAGKYKQYATDINPLSEDARKMIQEELDDIYSMFLSDVSRNIGVDVKIVKSTMAEGLVFMGQKALDVGLVNEIGDFDSAITKVKALVDFRRKPNKKGTTMNFEEYREKFPAEAQAGIDAVLASEKEKISKEVEEKLAAKTVSAEGSAEIDSLKDSVKVLTERLEAESKENKKAKITIAAMEERERQTKANAVMSTVLASSSLPTKAQDKVRSMFKDSKGVIALDAYIDESGSFDESKFSKAVSDEITSFEAIVSSASGVRVPQGTASADEGGSEQNDDISYGQEIVTARFGKQDR